MAKLSLLKGSTSQTVNVFIQDSTVTTGAGKTGLAYNTASLTAYYVRPKAAAAAITLATQTATGAFSSGGFVEIDATNLPGVYRLDVPDAALATGVGSVVVMLKGATGMAPLLLEIELMAVDNQDAVRGGMTALPSSGTLAVNPVLAATQTGVTIPTVTTLTNAPSDSSGVTTLLSRISAALGFTGANVNVQVKAQDNIDFGALQKAALNAATPASVVGAVGSVTADVGITQAGADKVWGTAARTLTSFGTLVADVWAYATRTLSSFSTALAVSVWDVLETAIATASSIGLKVKTNLDAAVSSRSTYAGGAVASVTGNVGGNVVGSVASVTADVGVTQAGADKVWSSAARSLTDKVGFALSAAGIQAIWDALTSALITVGSIGKKLADWVIGTTQTGDSFARLGASAGASVSADVAAVKADTAAVLVDTGTTLDARIPAALVGGRMDSNVGALNADATAAANLAKSASVIYRGSVTGAAATTTLIDSALTQAEADFWKGRIIIFTSGTLKYQATDITLFDPATDKLTFTALTAAPSAADTYVIV